MIRKFAMVSVCLLACIAIAMTEGVHAQQASAAPAAQAPASQTPATQTPAAQPQNGQETTEEEITPRRKFRPHDYRKWTFDVGAGASLNSGTTRTYVKEGGILGTVGVARNASRYLGLRADFFFVNLPLRDSALEQASAPGAHNGVYALTVNPIINVPITKQYSAYFVFGPAVFHRSGSLDSSTAVPGSGCDPFFIWWGDCRNNILPQNGRFLDSSQNEFGFDFGAGVARKWRGNKEFFAEFRFLHGKHSDISTDVRPVTVGIRW
jgi:opacity protein-like surface antigen